MTHQAFIPFQETGYRITSYNVCYTKLLRSFSVLEKSLKETTSKLRILNKHGVVDAGAKGFVLFIEGIISFLKTGNIRKVAAQSVENVLRVHSNLKAENDINFRYCTEAVIKDLSSYNFV